MVKRQVKRRIKAVANSEQDAPENTDVMQVGHRKHLRGRRGSLRDMPTMPLDILFEIFCYLDPIDLLNLARMNKDFCAVLMRKTSAPFWKAARGNVEDLPDLPPYLSEPAFANLVFCSFCHNCLKNNVHNVLWELRARYCNKCVRDMTERLYETKFVEIDGVWPYRLLNTSYVDNDQRKPERTLVTEVAMLQDSLSRMEPGSEEMREFVSSRTRHVAEIKQHSELCASWLQDKKATRSQEISNIKKKRLADAIAKLRESGWSKDLDFMAKGDPSFRVFMDLPLMKQPRPLSERAWKILQPILEEILEKTKVERLRHENDIRWQHRFTLLRNCIASSPLSFTIAPHVREIASFPEVRAILDVPDDAEVDASSLALLPAILPELEARWFLEKKGKFIEIIRKAVQLPDDVDPTTLAIGTFFNCKSYRSWQAFPAVEVDHCNRSFGAADSYEDKATQHLREFPWTYDSLSSPFEAVKAVIEACEQDPYTVTPADMDKLAIRLTCTTMDCCQPGTLTVMTWRAVLDHFQSRIHSPINDSSNGFPASWKIVSESDRIVAAELEKAANIKARRSYESYYAFACKRCPPNFTATDLSFRSRRAVVRHLLDEHQIENSVEDDIFHDPAFPGMEYLPVYLISKEVPEADLKYNMKCNLKNGTASFYDFNT